MNVKLMILGDDDFRKKYTDMIDSVKTKDTIHLAGFVENPFTYISRVDVVVFPSLYEGYSDAIVETLGIGVPCISSDHATGAREVLAPESDFIQKVSNQIEYAAYGVLVPVCDGEFRKTDEPLPGSHRKYVTAGILICRGMGRFGPNSRNRMTI